MARARYAVETRTRSSRTKSGWTKWYHYFVVATREDAERVLADGLWGWLREGENEARIVDRDALRPTVEAGK